MDILHKINWVDILVVIIVLRTGYVALQDGLSHEILPLIGSFVMIIFSLHYYHRIAIFLYNMGLAIAIEILDFIVFLALAIVISLLFRLAKAIIDKLLKITWHPLIEKFGGLIAGLTRGSILASAILIILVLLPLPYLQWSIRDRSFSGMYFLRIGPALYEKMSGMIPTVSVGGKPASGKAMADALAADKSLVIVGTKSPAKQK